MLGKTLKVLGLCYSASCFSGAYVGASLGPEGIGFNKKAHVDSSDFNVVDKTFLSGTGVFGSIFAGYQWIQNQYFLAAELNANLSSAYFKSINDEYKHSNFGKTTYTLRSSQGISVLPGYFIGPKALMYLRLGYMNAHLKINESDVSINSFNNHRNGIRYGLGMRYGFAEQWDVMLDYSQVNYSSVFSLYFDPIGGVKKDTKITPNSAQVGLGVIYHFS